MHSGNLHFRMPQVRGRRNVFQRLTVRSRIGSLSKFGHLRAFPSQKSMQARHGRSISRMVPRTALAKRSQMGYWLCVVAREVAFPVNRKILYTRPYSLICRRLVGLEKRPLNETD